MKLPSFAALRLLAGLFGFVGLALAARAQANLPNATVGQSYSFTITTTQTPPAGTIYGATNLPTGLSINASSGTISGTPTSPGTATGTLSLTSGGTANNYLYTLTVLAATGTPAITSAATTTGTVGQSFVFTLTASNGPTSYNVGTLPAGLSFTNDVNNPTISGTPTAAGTYPIAVSANNASGTGPSATLTITINPPGPVPAITSATTAAAALNAAFTYAITATNPPITAYSAVGLPLGLSINTSTGAITGTPTVAGVSTVALSATNSNGTGMATNLTLTVGALSVITSTSLSATAGQAANLSLTATNSPVSFNVSGLPSGLTANTSTGVISGTPASAGTFTLTVSANNATGTGAAASVTLTVAAAGGGGGGGGGGVTAPSITAQPSNQTVTAGTSATFTVAAAGTAPITYQWSKGGVAISGATSSTYTIAATKSSDAGSYTVVATNSGGSVTSNAATLTVLAIVTPVTITTQPAAQSVPIGGSATFSVTAAGSGTLSYQWSLNGTPITGATSAILNLANVQASNAGSYMVVVTNAQGSATSNSAVLTVGSAAAITTQPVSQTVKAGTSVTFTVAAGGTSPTYQWNFNGTPIAGATSASYTISSAAAVNAGSYTVTVTTTGGQLTSNGGVLAVQAAGAPAISSQPQSQTMATGSTVVLTVTSSGTVTASVDPAPVLRPEVGTSSSYQWYLNGVALSGATNSRLLISNLGSANAGTYNCLVSNSSGSTLSGSAVLAVSATSDPGRLINLSANAFDATGAQAMTIGFVTGGAGTSGLQTLLIRASGPALTAYGVTGILPDPALTVLNGSAVVTSNAGWGSPASNQAAVTAADTATFAFPLTNPSSLDSAVVATLATNPGYTVQIAGKSGDTGRTLAEVYDDTASGTYTATTPRLINLSCRIGVSAGSSLTAGFVIGGSTSKTVLVRASGPALTAYGVPGVMPDPQLQLFTGSTQIASNAGWGGDPQLTTAMSAVYAFPYTNSSSTDSAILVTLPPGAYTAVVTSASGTGGVTLVEVYDVP